jgi:hypothetical protein
MIGGKARNGGGGGGGGGGGKPPNPNEKKISWHQLLVGQTKLRACYGTLRFLQLMFDLLMIFELHYNLQIVVELSYFFFKCICNCFLFWTSCVLQSNSLVSMASLVIKNEPLLVRCENKRDNLVSKWEKDKFVRVSQTFDRSKWNVFDFAKKLELDDVG